MVSRESCWGSCLARSKAFIPTSRAWNGTEEIPRNCQESGFSHGVVKYLLRLSAGAAWSRSRLPFRGDLYKLLYRGA